MNSITPESFKTRYYSHIVPKLSKLEQYNNPMAVPRIEKIVINMGVGDAVIDSKAVDRVKQQLARIAGQKPIETRARKSVAAFKVREGMVLGCKVTLRGKKMYYFLERLTAVVLPRLRDFRGFTLRNFDGRGNFNFGLKEQGVFPEISYDEVDKVRGMDINIVINTESDEASKLLLQEFYFPFKK